MVAIAVVSVAEEPQHKEGKGNGSINTQFEDPKLDVSGFIKKFESNSREVFAKRAEILAACEIRPGMSVADLGAGTGIYTFPFAEKVGPAGTVFAVDISPGFLKYLADQAAKKGLSKVVKPLKGSHDKTNLPANSVDLIFVCDAYHHFEKPESILASIHSALRSGGKVILIDFDKRSDSSTFVKHHARAEKEVYYKELEAAGFTKLDVKSPPSLKENFFAAFQKADRKSGP